MGPSQDSYDTPTGRLVRGSQYLHIFRLVEGFAGSSLSTPFGCVVFCVLVSSRDSWIHIFFPSPGGRFSELGASRDFWVFLFDASIRHRLGVRVGNLRSGRAKGARNPVEGFHF